MTELRCNAADSDLTNEVWICVGVVVGLQDCASAKNVDDGVEKTVIANSVAVDFHVVLSSRANDGIGSSKANARA